MWWLNGKLVVAFSGTTKWQPYRLLKQAPLQNDNLALFSSYPRYKTDLNSTNPTEKHHAPTQETQSRSAVDNLHVLQCFAFLYHSLLSSTPGAKGHVGALELQNDKTGGCQANTPTKWQTCGVCEQPPWGAQTNTPTK